MQIKIHTYSRTTQEELAAEQQRMFDEIRQKLGAHLQQKVIVDDVTEKYRSPDNDANLSQVCVYIQICIYSIRNMFSRLHRHL
jgi:hypothetical protein